MGDILWTNEQLDAITEKDCNLLVAAAAGAGKTAVLVERIIKKITDPEVPVDIDKLLVVTFTNAAAAEMRERIAIAISRALEENPCSQNIQRQLTLLNKAHITTIHSFCLEVIRSNFQLINIDPNFRIADETEGVLMKLDVLDRLFEDIYESEKPDQDFFDLLECFGGNRDDQVLQDMVLNIYNFIQSSPWPEKWLEEMTENFNIFQDLDFEKTPWGKVLLDTLYWELAGVRDMMQSGVKILTGAEGLEKNLTIFQDELDRIKGLLKLCQDDRAGKWDLLYYEMQDIKYARLSGAGKNGDQEKHEKAKKIRDDMKDRMKKISGELFTLNSQEIGQDLKMLYPLMKRLAELVKELGVRYALKKSRKGVVDFNDLEHFCLEILTDQEENGGIKPSAPAIGYRERFSEILVDEYQDSNLVQEYIVKMISRSDTGRHNVFMVGDVKQSIYRFRQSKPELFLEKYNSYSAVKGQPFRKIQLYKNFRSRKEVIHGVNFIFKQIMSVNVGELDYTDEEALYPGANFAQCEEKAEIQVGGRVELHLMETEDKDKKDNLLDLGSDNREADEVGDRPLDNEDDEAEMLSKIQWEARLVAKRIQELMQSNSKESSFSVWDKKAGAYRTVDYRDIVILLRTTRRWSDIFVEELANQKIPAFADTGTGFFKSAEIQVVISLLQVIDNPRQDIPLLGVLRSPLVSFTTDELAELRLSDQKGDIYDALQTFSGERQSPGAKKGALFLAQLDKWRHMSRYMSADQLIWQLYQDTGYFSLVGGMPLGEQRQANLRVLFERARQFESTSYKGLFNFINFVDKLKSSQGDMGAAKILGENNNVVRIMSIHKSKGLEFPVVILSGCGKKFNLQDLYGKILLHQDLGFGPDIVDHKLRLSYPSHPKLAIREKLRRETLSEEMRILYVALTRAKEKLIITGMVPNMEKALAKWSGPASVKGNTLPTYEVLKGDKYLDWIGPTLLRHRDGHKLREIAGLEEELEGCLIDDSSLWDIKVWTKENVLAAKDNSKQEDNHFVEWLDRLGSLDRLDGEEGRFSEELAKRLNWEYSYKKVSRVPAKVSVTELKRWFEDELTEEASPYPENQVALVRKPLFLQEKKGLSRAEAGTVMHFVMQHLDYQREDIKGQLQEMLAKDLLTIEQVNSIDIEKIRGFLSSPLGRRLLSAESVHREVPFFMEIPCHELYPDLQDGSCREEKIILQGVIDCYFEESDGIVLLDYKTDYVPNGEMKIIRQRYQQQLSYYARALEMLTGKQVKEKYIYLFWTGEALEY